jgi:hypothetical protein
MIGEVAAEMEFTIFEDVAEGLFDEAGLAGEGNNADDGVIPNVLMLEFGDGNVEAAANAIFEAANDLALIFEGVSFGNADVESEKADGHEIRNSKPPQARMPVPP